MNASLLIGNDQTLEVTGVQDEISGAYQNSKTVTATVKNIIGVEVSGQSWPLTLSYVADSNGDYRGTLEDGLVLVNGKNYIIEITVDAGSDLIAFWRWTVPATYRKP